MGSKGSTTTTNQQSSYNPYGSNYLTQALNQAGQAAQNPYQAYGGELTAGINGTQQSAINGIAGATGQAANTYNTAQNMMTQAGQPITASQIAQYESPYTSQVVDATQAQFNQQNAQQQSQVTGNAALQGAMGGDRVGVAQANTAAQQQTAQAPVIAGLENQGYQTALSTAQQQQQNQANAAMGLGSLATNSTGIYNNQLGAGTLQQQTQQAGDTANYQQFQNQQSYPFQTAQFLSSIFGSLAPSLGGTTTGTGSSTAPAPNYLSQLLGLGTAGLGALSDARAKHNIEPVGKLFDGTNLYRFQYHGDPQTHIGVMAQEVEQDKPHSVGTGLDGLKRVDYKSATDDSADIGHFANGGFAMGGMPYSNGQSGNMGYVPAPVSIQSSGTKQPSLPSMPSAGGQSGTQAMQQTDQALQKFGTAFGKSDMGQNLKSSIFGNPGSPGLGQLSPGAGSSDPTSSAFVGPMAPTSDMSMADSIPMAGIDFARGGFIKGYDDGGGVPIDDLPAVQSDSIVPAIDQALQPPVPAQAAQSPAMIGPPAPDSAPPVPVAAPPLATTNVAPPPPVAQAADNSAPPVATVNHDPAHVPSLGDIFREKEKQYGLPPGYLAHTAKTESDFNPNAHNDDSDAAGLFQFVPKTAKEYDLSNPYDPVASTDAAARLAANNAEALRAGLNREPTAGELYLAHQQGAKGAIALLNHPDDPASSMVGKAAVAQNGGTAGMTGAQFIAKWAPDSPVLPQSGGSALAFDADASRAANSSGLPSEITKGRSDYASPPVPVDASASAPVTPKQAEKESKMWKSLIPGMSDDARMALMNAGFGMMASTSPNFGVGVGQGALQGLSAYQKAQQLSQQSELQKAQIANLGAETLSHQAEAQQKQIAATQAKQSMAMRQQIMASPLFGGSGTPGVPPTTTTADGKTVPVAQPPISATANKDLKTVTSAAGIQQTQNGPVLVNKAGEPLENLGVLQQRADLLTKAGIVDPEMGKIGQAIQTRIDTMQKAGTQVAADGSLVPIQGAAEAAARAAQMKTQAETRAAAEKEGVRYDQNGNVIAVPGFGDAVSGIAGQKSAAEARAKAPYEILANAARESGRAQAIGPNQTIATGAQINPNLGNPITWAQQQAGIQPAAPPASPNAPGAQGTAQANPPGGVSAFTPHLVQNADGTFGSSVTTGSEAVQRDAAAAYKTLGDSAKAAETAKYRLGMIEHDIDTLNKDPLSSTGAGANTRLAFAQTVNSYATSLGLKPPFDPNKVASWEDLNKESAQLGFATARSLGAREAASVVDASMKANPNVANTPQGAKMVLNGMKLAAKAETDLYDFTTNYIHTHGGDIIGAQTEFYKLNPPSQYRQAATAIAEAPDHVANLKAHPETAPMFDKKYGPGTAKILLSGE